MKLWKRNDRSISPEPLWIPTGLLFFFSSASTLSLKIVLNHAQIYYLTTQLEQYASDIKVTDCDFQKLRVIVDEESASFLLGWMVLSSGHVHWLEVSQFISLTLDLWFYSHACFDGHLVISHIAAARQWTLFYFNSDKQPFFLELRDWMPIYVVQGTRRTALVVANPLLLPQDFLGGGFALWTFSTSLPRPLWPSSTFLVETIWDMDACMYTKKYDLPELDGLCSSSWTGIRERIASSLWLIEKWRILVETTTSHNFSFFFLFCFLHTFLFEGSRSMFIHSTFLDWMKWTRGYGWGYGWKFHRNRLN
jgi:hypothetical protein